MPKKALRQMMLAKRRMLSSHAVTTASLIIQKTFLGTAEFSKAEVLGLYAPYNNEVKTTYLMNQALILDKKVLFPVVFNDGLIFRRITDPTKLHPGFYGILEPAASCTAYEIQSLDIVIVPGIAFDVHGRRIGYGKGFYDKALHLFEGKGRLVAFCYDFQLVDEIIQEPHDVNMDIIVTEKRVIRPRF